MNTFKSSLKSCPTRILPLKRSFTLDCTSLKRGAGELRTHLEFYNSVDQTERSLCNMYPILEFSNLGHDTYARWTRNFAHNCHHCCSIASHLLSSWNVLFHSIVYGSPWLELEGSRRCRRGRYRGDWQLNTSLLWTHFPSFQSPPFHNPEQHSCQDYK